MPQTGIQRSPKHEAWGKNTFWCVIHSLGHELNSSCLSGSCGHWFHPKPQRSIAFQLLKSHYKLYKPVMMVNKILRKVSSSVEWVLIFKFSNVSVREMAKCCKILCMDSCISKYTLEWTGSDIFVCERYHMNIPFRRRNTRFGVWGNKLRTKSRYL